VKIAIQGVKASFHDVAARKYFSNHEIEPVECPSFKTLSLSLKNCGSDLAVMAIENSIAGSILPNYTLLETYGFKIIGEVYLRIEMDLMALPGQKLEELKFVQSHPMALLQCDDFLASHLYLKVLEGSDTAESAKDIRDKSLVGYAAIASGLAAKTYGLEVLRSGIETNKQNYTRFLVICRGEEHTQASNSNKTSIRFEVSDRPGSLARVLEDFSRLSVNMTKIQSVPILGRPYEYSFHVDLEWKSRTNYENAMRLVSQDVINLIHFGDYPSSERPSV
jgi:prephenate dehydratase